LQQTNGPETFANLPNLYSERHSERCARDARPLPRHHPEHPNVFDFGAQEYRVGYLPAESDTGMVRGNFNCRGPIRMTVKDN
jgi:hypothetical protein